MKIDRLDHLVLTVTDIDRSCEFYARVMGMEVVTFGTGRKALSFGQQKINLHQAGQEFTPHAHHPTPGSADLCFITTTPVKDVLLQLQAKSIKVIEGPVEQTGATGRIRSLYFRDPDDNLIEVSNYL